MNRWDERYATFGASYGIEPNDFLVHASRFLAPAARVLSIGEGEGRNAMFLLRQGHHVTVVDSSRLGLGDAARWAEREGLDLVTIYADLATFDFGFECWDAIVSVWCHLPPGLRRVVHRGAVAGLRPGGLFILEGYRPEQLEYRTGGPSDRDHYFTLLDLQDDLAGLEFVHALETLRDVFEGQLHNGRSAVVQLIGRKAERTSQPAANS